MLMTMQCICSTLVKIVLYWMSFLLQDECSYVSLRDVERFMIVYDWFHKMYRVIAAEMTDVSRRNATKVWDDMWAD